MIINRLEYNQLQIQILKVTTRRYQLVLSFLLLITQLGNSQETKDLKPPETQTIEQQSFFNGSTWRPFTVELTGSNIGTGVSLESPNLAFGFTIEKQAKKNLYLRATAISDFNVMGPGFKLNMGVLNTIFTVNKTKFRAGVEIGIKSALEFGFFFQRKSSGAIEFPFLLQIPLFDKVSLDVGFRSAIGPFLEFENILSEARFSFLNSYHFGFRYTFEN